MNGDKPAVKPGYVDCRGGLFLTYPQFASRKEDVDLDQCKTNILAILEAFVTLGRVKSWDCGVVAREHHESGEVHLHIYAHASLEGETKRFRVPHAVLDKMGKHGNYQAAMSDIAVAKYCTKDGDYVWWGRDPSLRQEVRGKKRNLLLADIITGKLSIEDAVMQSPELILKYDTLTQNLEQFQAAKRASGPRLPPVFIYLAGPSGVGKTTMAESLCPPSETYKVPLPTTGQKTWWFNGYRGQQCLVFDNVSKETVPPYDLLCQVIDSSSCRIPVKGGLVSCAPSLIVVTSVLHPSDLWGQNWDIQMKRRLTFLYEAFLVNARGEKLGMQEAQEEMRVGGLNSRNVIWESTPLSAFKVLTLPDASMKLMAELQASLKCGVQKPPTPVVETQTMISEEPWFEAMDSGQLVNLLNSEDLT